MVKTSFSQFSTILLHVQRFFPIDETRDSIGMVLSMLVFVVKHTFLESNLLVKELTLRIMSEKTIQIDDGKFNFLLSTIKRE